MIPKRTPVWFIVAKTAICEGLVQSDLSEFADVAIVTSFPGREVWQDPKIVYVPRTLVFRTPEAAQSHHDSINAYVKRHGIVITGIDNGVYVDHAI